MQTTYAKRLKSALAHAGLSQAELARSLDLQPQAVQYLTDEKNNARGSRHTGGFARACGVNPIWLESGAGEMLVGGRQAREAGARYKVDTPAALLKAIRALNPELRQAIAQIVNALSATQGARSYSLSAGESSAEHARPRARRVRTA